MRGLFVSGARGAARPGILESCFGPLEIALLEVLWRHDSEVSVRALAADFPGAAYTTLMTTVDRLFKKDVLERRQEGRAYLYRPSCTRGELEMRLARGAFDRMLARGPAAAEVRPVLSGLVDAVGEQDALLLDELERLVREKREASAQRRNVRKDRR